MGNKQRQIVALILLIIMCCTLFSGCDTFDNFKNSFMKSSVDDKTTVRIGVFEPLSGKEKKYGKLELQGIRLAHELYPTVIGKNVVLVYGDNKSDMDFAATAAQDLVKKKVAVVLGSHGNTLSLVGGEYFEKAKIPAIAITSTNPLVTGSNDYYFRTCFVDSFQGVALAKYIVQQLGISNAAIFKDSKDDYAAALSQTFSDKVIQLTEDENAIASVIEYKSDQKDFKKQLQTIKDAGIKVVLLASKSGDAIKIMRQAKEMGLQLLFLGTDDWESKNFLKEGGAAVEGAVFSTLFDASATITSNSAVFLEAYRAKYGYDAEPESEVALGFDAYLLAINAIKGAGTSINGEVIRDKLASTKNYAGASGNITFDENGDPIKSVVIKTITNGEFVHIYTVEPTWQ